MNLILITFNSIQPGLKRLTYYIMENFDPFDRAENVCRGNYKALFTW